METLKMYKKARLHFLVFACGCVISNFGFFLNRIMPRNLYLGIGLYSMLLWSVNPLPLLFSVKGLLHYCKNRKDEDTRTIVGKKWIALPAILLASVILYCLSAEIMVTLTGGA